MKYQDDAQGSDDNELADKQEGQDAESHLIDLSKPLNRQLIALIAIRP